LVSILNLGNVKFVDAKRGESALDEDTIDFATKFGSYMGIEDPSGVESILTKKFKESFGEEMYTGMEPPMAYKAKDSLAKLVFKRMFDFIVEKINVSL